jgi:hypothetical protein
MPRLLCFAQIPRGKGRGASLPGGLFVKNHTKKAKEKRKKLHAHT